MDTRSKLMAIGALFVVLAGVGLWYSKDDRSSNPAPVQTDTSTVAYDSAADGISFSYPSSYKLEERLLQINGVEGKYLTLLPADVVVPQAGEGAPGITIEIFKNPQKLSVADWLQTITSGTPAPASGWDYAETKVGGQDATAYSATGLYESDNVAVAYGTHIYVFSATWLTRSDKTLIDLEAILKSVQFK